MMHVTVPMDREYHAKIKKIAKDRGFPSTAQMIRTAVDNYINDNTSMTEKQLLPIKDMLITIAEDNGKTQEWIELLDVRLQMKEGYSSIICAATKEIIKLLMTEEKDRLSIMTKLKSFDRETINASIILLHNLGLIGSYRKKN